MKKEKSAYYHYGGPHRRKRATLAVLIDMGTPPQLSHARCLTSSFSSPAERQYPLPMDGADARLHA